jgi:hypothetical protein
MDTIETLQAELAKQKVVIAAFQKENEELKNAGKKAEAEAYFSKMRDAGKLMPALVEQAVALDMRMDEEERKAYRLLFEQATPRVDLSGKHRADKKDAKPQTGVHARIKAFQAEKQLASYAEAAEALYAEKPEWFAEGAE